MTMGKTAKCAALLVLWSITVLVVAAWVYGGLDSRQREFGIDASYPIATVLIVAILVGVSVYVEHVKQTSPRFKWWPWAFWWVVLAYAGVQLWTGLSIGFALHQTRLATDTVATITFMEEMRPLTAYEQGAFTMAREAQEGVSGAGPALFLIIWMASLPGIYSLVSCLRGSKLERNPNTL